MAMGWCIVTVRVEGLHGRMRPRKGTLHACVQQTQSMTTLQICKRILLSGPSHKKQPSTLENVSRHALEPCRFWLNNARRSSCRYEMCVYLMCEEEYSRWMQQTRTSHGVYHSTVPASIPCELPQKSCDDKGSAPSRCRENTTRQRQGRLGRIHETSQRLSPIKRRFTVVDMHSAGQNPKSWLISRCSTIPTM